MLTRKLSWVVAFHIVKYAHLRFMLHVGPSSQVAFSEHRTLCGPVRLNPGSQLYVAYAVYLVSGTLTVPFTRAFGVPQSANVARKYTDTLYM